MNEIVPRWRARVAIEARMRPGFHSAMFLRSFLKACSVIPNDPNAKRPLTGRNSSIGGARDEADQGQRPMGETQEGLPPDFYAWLKVCRQAERDAWACLARYRTTPTSLTRLAVDAAWSALEVALGILESWLKSHPETPIASTIADAQAARDGLFDEIKLAGLMDRWGKELPRH